MDPAYREQMQKQLGSDAGLYFDALTKDYVRGIRLNARKPAALPPEGLLEPVPWAGNASYYLANDSAAGAHPLHEAGAWYIQEPSAMASVAVLSPKPGEIVLDLCAAPGGKSTQIAEKLAGEGLLVCNEPVTSRAKILSRNIERMGIPNALVVSTEPENLARRWEGLFDAVLVDAPCSGEGMFRRHPETMEEWHAGSPRGCAERQRSILEEAIRMVRPGGRLVYSTCTFNQVENEGVIASLLAAHAEWEAVPFSLPEAGDAPEGMLHLYPHRVRGEGHFVALLRKNGGDRLSPISLPKERNSVSQKAEGRNIKASRAGEAAFLSKQALPAPNKELLAAWRAFADGRRLPTPNAVFGEILLSVPPLPPLSGVKVLRAGLQLGIRKGKVFVPDHALALSFTDEPPFPTVELSLSQARLYQAGESLLVPDELRGWVLPSFGGVVLGFGKASGGEMKNHYPKGLRRNAGE